MLFLYQQEYCLWNWTFVKPTHISLFPFNQLNNRSWWGFTFLYLWNQYLSIIITNFSDPLRCRHKLELKVRKYLLFSLKSAERSIHKFYFNYNLHAKMKFDSNWRYIKMENQLATSTATTFCFTRHDEHWCRLINWREFKIEQN